MSERELENNKETQEVGWVEQEFKRWQNAYEIPVHKEFYVREFLKTQEQFANTPQEHTKAKLDLLHMIKDLDVSDTLKERCYVGVYIMVDRIDSGYKMTACKFSNLYSCFRENLDEIADVIVSNFSRNYILLDAPAGLSSLKDILVQRNCQVSDLEIRSLR